jgi:hypothetical protein
MASSRFPRTVHSAVVQRLAAMDMCCEDLRTTVAYQYVLPYGTRSQRNPRTPSQRDLEGALEFLGSRSLFYYPDARGEDTIVKLSTPLIT